MKSVLPLIFCCGILVPAHAATVIHSWDFEGDYLDQVGAANGNVTGSTTVTMGTGFGGGSAVVFQRSASTNGNATVTIAHTSVSPTIVTPMAGFSITYWFKFTTDALINNRGFYDFNGNGTDSGYQGLYLGATKQLNFRVDNGLNTNAVVFISQETVSVEDDQWHHVAVTFTPGAAVGGFLAYLDGVPLTNSFVNNGATLNNTSGFTAGDIDAQNNPSLGAYNLPATAGNVGLGGSLDDFQIWSGVLSSSEVATLAVPEASTTAFGALACLALLRRRR